MKKIFSVRSLLILSHVLLLVTSLGAIGYVWSHNEYQIITSELKLLMRERVTHMSSVFEHEFAEQPSIDPGRVRLSETWLTEDQAAVFIDSAGNLYKIDINQDDPEVTDYFLAWYRQHSNLAYSYAEVVPYKENSSAIYAAAPVFTAPSQFAGMVCLLVPLEDITSYIQRQRYLLIFAIFGVTLLGIGTSTVLNHYLSRQIKSAQNLATVITEGDYEARIPEAGPTELRDLSHHLNLIGERLQTQSNIRRQILANVTHELARPLAGLQLGIESLRKGAIHDPELADDLLVSMERSINRLRSRVEDIALAAKPESYPIHLERDVIAVEPFLKGVATFFWGAADMRGIRFKVQVEANVPAVYADEKRLNQIVGNLVDNALKFTPRGKTIFLSAEQADEEHVRIMVRDSGKGLTEVEIEHIFEPFFQGDLGRRVKQGMGLGLSISRDLAEAHEGSLTIQNHPAGGAVAILTLPIART